MEDLLSKYEKSRRAIKKPKQPNFGEMNRNADSITNQIPSPSTTLPKKSLYQPAENLDKYTNTIYPLPIRTGLYIPRNPGINTQIEDTRRTTYINNNYAGDDYVD